MERVLIILAVASIAVLSMASCKKTYTCNCTIIDRSAAYETGTNIQAKETELTTEYRRANRKNAADACASKEKDYSQTFGNAGSTAVCKLQ